MKLNLLIFSIMLVLDFLFKTFFACSMVTEIFSYVIVSTLYCLTFLLWIYNLPGIDVPLRCDV